MLKKRGLNLKQVLKDLLWLVGLVAYFFFASKISGCAIDSEQDIHNLPVEERIRYEQMIW